MGFDIPKAPNVSLDDKINGIIEDIENPCFAPWYVYLRLAKKPLFNAVIALLLFGFDDVIRGYFRPAPLRAKPHMRRGRPRIPRRPGLPEIGEWVGRNLPGAAEAAGRRISAGQSILWMLDGVAQRGLWYWLVLDVSTDFVYGWASAVQESEFCRKQNIPFCHWKSVPDANWFSPANAWTTIGTTILVNCKEPATSQNGSFWAGNLPFNAIVAAKMTPLSDPPGKFEIRIGVTNQPKVIYNTDDNPLTLENQLVAKEFSHQSPILAQYRTNGGVFKGEVDCICQATHS